MDADLEKLLREVWADLRAQLSSIKRSSAPVPTPLRELEPLDLDFAPTDHDFRLARIEARLTRLEKHVGLLDS